MKVFITGIAGFVGYSVAKALMWRGHSVSGWDTLSPYYSKDLKIARLRSLGIEMKMPLEPDVILHLAAQPGVMHSVKKPLEYTSSNVTFFMEMLEYARRTSTPFVYATSSTALRCKSLYGITKKFDEMAAQLYKENYGMDITGLRLHSVYGPWGRPDMGYWLFTEKILKGEPITVRDKDSKRDYTYIDDVVEVITRVIEYKGVLPDIVDIGRGKSRTVDEVLDVLEASIGKKAERIYADRFKEEESDNITRGPQCTTDIEVGLPIFVDWYMTTGGFNGSQYFNPSTK